MKTLFAALLLCVALVAQAQTTVSFTIQPAELAMAVDACTTATRPVDAQTPPQPRNCTNAETRAWILSVITNVVKNHKQAKDIRTATDAVAAPAFNPQ